MKMTEEQKQKAESLFRKGMNLSHVYYALEGVVPYVDLWELKAELSKETGPVSGDHATRFGVTESHGLHH